LTAALAVPLVFGVLLIVEGVVLILWEFRIRDRVGLWYISPARGEMASSPRAN
jgi:hypothetical protein